jgi:hypothetical protein
MLVEDLVDKKEVTHDLTQKTQGPHESEPRCHVSP